MQASAKGEHMRSHSPQNVTRLSPRPLPQHYSNVRTILSVQREGRRK